MVALKAPSFSKLFLLAALIAGLLMSGSPSFIGITFVTFDSKPALGVDICHPLQMADLTTGAVPCVPMPPFSLRPIVADFGTQVQWLLPKPKDRSDPPDTPPPR
jgi:hypothetical protein